MTDLGRPVTVEEFLESMTRWISVSPSRSVRRGDPQFEREDMMQEARYALLQVVRDYPEKLAAGELDELQKIGRRAIFFHTGNLYYESKSKRRGGEAAIVSMDQDQAEAGRGERSARDLDVDPTVRAELSGPHHDVALDRLIVREEVERIAGELGAACCVFRYAMDPCPGTRWVPDDTRPAESLPSGGAMKIFRRVKKRVRSALLRDGYMGGEGKHMGNGQVNTLKEGRKMEVRRVDVAPVSPDIAAPVLEAPKQAPAAKNKKVKEKTKSGTARQSSAETAKASAAFAKGQKVTYVGGGRASWLKDGSTLEVRGSVVSRGRTYVRCVVVTTNAKGRKISLSSALLKK